MEDRRQVISRNLASVRRRIAVAADRCGRNPDDIHLLAISKFQSASDVELAAACGLRDFGENYVSEAVGKISALSRLSLRWHCTGPLQSNKTRYVAQSFSWLHTLDREKIAVRLSADRPTELPPLNVCLQVRLSKSGPGSGVDPDAALSLAQTVSSLPGLRLRGLMTLPGPEDDAAGVFARLRGCLQEVRAALAMPLDTLSMGMSRDLEVAVAEGASILRIGTALFGRRSTGSG